MKPFAAVLAILALVFGLAFAFRSTSNRPSLAGLEAALVCTTCHEPLDESNSPLAQQMEAVIRAKIAAGWTTSQIENYFVAQLGPQVLAVPKERKAGVQLKQLSGTDDWWDFSAPVTSYYTAG